ncbi:ferredoxin [Amycolatopsis sp. NBC_00345]|uniref:ferredoxin n=1 Tax=Amycolatopsis sp. NBC_00345 TaxID=2975955 RepID=UPI002E26588A
MTTPPAPLGPEQQQAIVAGIGRGLAGLVPPGWRLLRVDYRAAGRHVECDVHVTTPDGAVRPVPTPPEVVARLGELRSGMYRPGTGTWLAASLAFDPARGAQADFVLDREPSWRRPPPPIGFQDELRFFPRADQHVPAWLRARAGLPPLGATPAVTGAAPPADGGATPPAAGAPGDAVPPPASSPQPASGAVSPPPAVASPPAETAAGIRTPRVYDGLDEAGRPVVSRERLSAEERERVLAYLETAPAVLASRSYGADAFDPSRADVVPLTFRTDGSWAWPGAVAYYLREHEIAPDPELLTHIRGHRFAVPEVGEPARELALASVTGQPST